MMPMPQILNRPKFRSSCCGWPEALISLVSRVSVVDLIVESDDCSAATTNFSMFQTAVSMGAPCMNGWMAEWPEFLIRIDKQSTAELAIYTKRKRAARSKNQLGFFVGGISLFQMLRRARLAYPSLFATSELAFVFTLLFNWLYVSLHHIGVLKTRDQR